MEPKGHVVIKKKLVHTTRWPDPELTPKGIVDVEKEYKEALCGKVVQVMDVAVDGSGYLVFCETKSGGGFLWMIEKGDTVEGSFFPFIKKNWVVMPAGLDPLTEMAYMADAMLGAEYSMVEALNILKKNAKKE